MKEILIVSGKGGAGKTSLAACFAQLAHHAVLVDCDVDASDLPLLLHPEVTEQHEFFSGVIPVIDSARCTRCGICGALCRFEAISCEHGVAELSSGSCEGCGVCADHCPAQAITLTARRCGEWMRSGTACGTMFHAALLPGAENSGKLIAEIRAAARREAESQNCDWLLSDGPPGIGCPVISAVTGVDFAVIVTEPTVSGIHDMKRLAALLRQFETPFALLVNKSDLNLAAAAELKQFCAANRIPMPGEIPFDPLFPAALRDGKTVLDYPESSSAHIVAAIWSKLTHSLIQPGESSC